MIRKRFYPLVIMCVMVFIIYPGRVPIGYAKDHPEKTTTKNKPKDSAPDQIEKKLKPTFTLPEPIVTDHSINIKGKTINYKSTTGYLPLQDKSESPEARIFFIAYENSEHKNKALCPVTFAFNGGPGASSVYLHLGALGPKRAFLKEEGNNAAPPYQLVDNEYTWLESTDLVFIDPVGTGYSRPGTEKDEKIFYGLKTDIKAVAQFIRRYITKYNRWLSPKFIAGESYGTTRAVGLSSYLQDTLNININGLMLISPVLDFHTIIFNRGNDLPYSLFLPAYTATAWYHKKLAPELQSKSLSLVLEDAQSWALTTYSSALVKGNALTEKERRVLIEKLSLYTGLSPSFIQRHNLRIDQSEFTKELLKEQNRLLGILDSRFLGIDPDPVYEYDDYDPSLFPISVSFGAMLNDYVKNELNFISDIPYHILNRKVNRSWDWCTKIHGGPGYVNVMGELKKSISKNPHLKLFIAAGYYDLATPYFATQYTLHHLDLDPTLKDNISVFYYEVGHQVYVHMPSLIKLTDDVTAFMKNDANIGI